MNIQELFATLGLEVDVAAFARGEAALETIKVAGQLVKKALSAAFDIATETASFADDVDAAAQRTGVAAEALQELTHAASGSGFDLSSMAMSLGFLNKAMVQSKGGSKELAQLFKDLGVDVTGANGGFLSAQDVLEQVADRFAEMPDGAEKSAAAVQLFGKSGAQMIPFLNKGADGIAELRAQARDLGLVLSEDQVKAGAKANDSWKLLKDTATGLKRTLGAELFPVLAEVAGGLAEWVRENRALIGTGIHTFVMLLTFAVRLLRAVLNGVGEALGWVGRNGRIVAWVLGSLVLAAVLLNIKAIAAWVIAQTVAGAAAVKSALLTALAWGAAALPLLALAALIAGLAYVAWRFSDEIWAVVKEVGGAFADMGAGIRDLFAFIFDWLTGKFSDFIGWVEKQIDRVTRAAKWVKDQIAPDAETMLGQLGLGTQLQAFKSAQSSIDFGRGIGAKAVASLPAGARAGATQVSNSVQQTFNISGAQDPNAIADEVAARQRESQNALLREALAGIG